MHRDPKKGHEFVAHVSPQTAPVLDLYVSDGRGVGLGDTLDCAQLEEERSALEDVRSDNL